jgi:hypothetical protein
MNLLLFHLAKGNYYSSSLSEKVEFFKANGLTFEESVDDEGHGVFDFLISVSNQEDIDYLNQFHESIHALFPEIVDFLASQPHEYLQKSAQKNPSLEPFLNYLFDLQAPKRVKKAGRNVRAAEIAIGHSHRPNGSIIAPNVLRLTQQFLSGAHYRNKNVPPSYENTMKYLKHQHNLLKGGKKTRRHRASRKHTRKHKHRRA